LVKTVGGAFPLYDSSKEKLQIDRRLMSDDSEFIIFCDESDVRGRFYSNFYGGVIVGSSNYDRITQRLNAAKNELNLFGEVKWSKVSEPYLPKYQALMRIFFEEVRDGNVKVRIMFRQNRHQPVGLTQEQIEGTYFRLYYQFIKHAFGLGYHPGGAGPARLRLYFDEFPETKEAATQFKGFLLGLNNNPKISSAGFIIAPEDIAEIRSHDHVLAQCLDVVLGAMAFRLNDKHKEKPPGALRRGKRTIAKEHLYHTIRAEILKIKPNFNIGISTGTPGGLVDRWTAAYLHWQFIPAEFEHRAGATKRKK
jgi:hypothetical protein